MKILNEYPPQFEKIEKVFNLSKRTAVFTYGDTIYNPWGGNLSKDLIAHESIHEKQQGDDPDGWWEKYMSDVQFRLSQEVEAYQKQFRSYCGGISNVGKMRKMMLEEKFLQRIAGDLSSPLYGSIVTLTEAKKLIRNL